MGPSNYVLLIKTGIGPDKARFLTQQLLEGADWDLVISTGFAGALNSSPVGTLLIGKEVVFSPTQESSPPSDLPRIVCHANWVNEALSVGLKMDQPIQIGRFVTVDRVLTLSSQKQAVGRRTGAVAVDMESGAIGQVTQQYGLPFLIVRAVSDTIKEDLPADFNVFFKPFGWILGVAQILLTPQRWGGFFRLYRNSRKAAEQLSHFFDNFLSSTFTTNSQLPPVSLKSK